MSQKRSIFEEVGATEHEAPAAAPKRPDGRDTARRSIRWWLAVLFLLVLAMIVVGGLTRLTDSGLSITEWAPITGVVPPLVAVEWLAEFDRYKAIPEFELQNADMTLEEFKVIYWWEWGHRFLGRIVGLVWAIGFVWFLAKKQIPSGWTGRLFLLGVLGGLQGAIGWWMVASGLEGDRVDVASYRLAVHLGLAFFILGLIAWFHMALGQRQMDLMQARRRREGSLGGWTNVLIPVLFVQILLGALVAGIDAGRSYTDWPLMGGEFFPSTGLDLTPIWLNFFENAGLTQFVHRMWGYLALILVLTAWARACGSAVLAVKRGFDWLAVAVFGQMVLGVVTVLYAVPLMLAILHQLGAVVVMVVAIRARFLAYYPPEQRIARG